MLPVATNGVYSWFAGSWLRPVGTLTPASVTCDATEKQPFSVPEPDEQRSRSKGGEDAHRDSCW